MSDSPAIVYHHDAKLFRDAIRFTSAETAFSERLIEKDYHCSVLLGDLRQLADAGLVFKGGTCLSKVHASFFRLSEDLDFGVSMPTGSSRIERRRRMAPIKAQFEKLLKRQTGFRVDQPLRGFNVSTQYAARLAYTSVVTGHDETIKIEISIREPIAERAPLREARTMLLDPFRAKPAVPGLRLPVLSLREAYAEKLRAALTRRETAIRDFFDLDHAFSAGLLDASDRRLIRLLQTKLAVPGNDPLDLSAPKIQQLRAQVETQLRPVLRTADFERFDLDRAVSFVARMAQLATE